MVIAALVGCVVGAVIALANTGGSASDDHNAKGAGATTLPPPSSAASPSPSASPAPKPTPAAVRPQPVSQQALARLPQATTFGRIENASADPAPTQPTNGAVVHPSRTVPIYLSPGGPAIGALPTTQIGQPTWFPIIRRTPGWVQVPLPSKPNGRTGWLWTGDGSLTEAHTSYLIRVSLAGYKLSLYDNGRLVGSWTAGFGMDVDPTPTGRAFLLSSITDPEQTYSPVIIPLSVHSPTLDTFGGGPGTVAIHTWPDPSVFGTKSSNGCIRIPASGLSLIERVPLGTVVLISST